MMIPTDLLMTSAYWYDAIQAGHSMGTTSIVSGLLLMFLLLAMMMPVVWGSFRVWRQFVRAAAEVRVRPTGG